MNALALPPHTAVPPPETRLARVEIFAALDQAEPNWRALEGGFATPYQLYDFLAAWQRHVGAPAGVTPSIVVGFDAPGQPLFLWPFGHRRLGPCRAIEFLGGKHTNFNMALWRCSVAGTITHADLEAVLARLAGHADLVRLCNQPLSWDGITNPFALLAHGRAANFGFSGPLVGAFEVLLRARTKSATRKKMRKKERALASLGTVRFERVRGRRRIRQVLDAFFKQKSARTRAFGIADVFAEPGVRRFIEAAASEASAGGEPAIELYALSVDDVVVAGGKLARLARTAFDAALEWDGIRLNRFRFRPFPRKREPVLGLRFRGDERKRLGRPKGIDLNATRSTPRRPGCRPPAR